MRLGPISLKLDFNKQNTVFILLVLNLQRDNGSFLSDLIEDIAQAVFDANSVGKRSVSSISRATFYNYFGDIKKAFPDGYDFEKAMELANKFCRDHPKAADKHYKKFTKVTFETTVQFLSKSDFLGKKDTFAQVAAIQDSLFYSLSGFLGADDGDWAKGQELLSGDYRVFRPSLSSPGKILVSCARISEGASGALTYLEVMHLKNETGWRRQILDGYVVVKDQHIAVITRDTNTQFAQFSILHSLLIQPSSGGKNRIERMAGTYSGVSVKKQIGLYSTGIYLLRDNFEAFSHQPMREWEAGRQDGFGALEPEDVPSKIRSYLFEYPVL